MSTRIYLGMSCIKEVVYSGTFIFRRREEKKERECVCVWGGGGGGGGSKEGMINGQ